MPFDQSPPADAAHEAEAPHEEASQPEQTNLLPVFAVLFLLIAGWATSVAVWGLPGLFIPALCAVPVMMLIVIRLAWG